MTRTLTDGSGWRPPVPVAAAAVALGLLVSTPRLVAQAEDGAGGEAETRTEDPAGGEAGTTRTEVRPRSEPPALPGESDLVTLLDRPQDGELEVVIGPVSLPAGGPHLRLPVQMVTLPIQGWLHGYAWSVTDAAGRRLPDRLLHHVNFLDPDRRELFAPIPRRMLSAGRETARQEMPRLLGYPIEAGTRALIAPMFANPTEADYDEAYLRIRLFYTGNRDALIRPRSVYPFYLDVMGPVGPKHFEVPPGDTVVSWEGRPAIDGRLLAIGGHLHDHGTRLRLVDVTAGEVLYEVEPETDETGRVVRVPTAKLWWKGGIRISKDHTYRIEAVYRNPLDRPAPEGGMGVLGGVVLASDDARWPPLDRSDAAYVEDLRNTLEEPYRDSGHGMHGGGSAAREGHDHGDPGAHGGRDGPTEGEHGDGATEDEHGDGATEGEHGGS